jgi:predicted Zn-ribbon and HTH transcriptional regulator
MSKERTSLVNESSSLIAKTHDLFHSSPPVFVLCDTCYWCATYFDKTKIPRENKCPQCKANNNELSSFPIMPNESFTYNYNDKRGVELEFKPRRKSS